MIVKLKKIIMYSVMIALPVGLIYIGAKYFFNKSSGSDVKPEEAVAEAVGFVKRVFKIVSTSA